jgi:nicotinate-nucleotide pyrophosphorylase (carboxylating)
VLPEGALQLIDEALQEDIGGGDHSANGCIAEDDRGSAQLLVKDTGVLAGVELAQAVADRYDNRLNLRVLLQDGAAITPGDVAFTISGNARSILAVERLMLNFMQRMSGIATTTRAYVQAVHGTGCKVLDTRKTTPALRAIEKWAVRIGGGNNHRFGLYDMVMIKDNHHDLAGGITKAVRSVQRYLQEKKLALAIEVEVRNMRELEETMAAGGVQRIMLDNFALPELRKAVQRIGGKVETEASGGITLENVRAYAECGPTYVSIGALTHSLRSLDLSLKAM